MNRRSLILLFFALLIGGIGARAEDMPPGDITIQGAVIALSKAQALQFLSGHALDAEPGKALAELQTLVEGKKAAAAANPAVTTKSGQQASSESGTTKLSVEPILSPLGDRVDINLTLGYGENVRLSTSFEVKTGDVKFIGAFDAVDENKDLTYLIFVRVTSPR